MCKKCCDTCIHSDALTLDDVACCNCCEDHELYEEITAEQKRSYINHRCRAYEIDDKCICTLGDKKCPFSDDPNAWCKVGHLHDVPDDHLDDIVKKFMEV